MYQEKVEIGRKEESMKSFRTLPEAREYMDGVLARLGGIMRSHDCLFGNMSPLEYMYMAIAEAVNPQSEAHHHWTQRLSYSHLMTHIMQMDPCDILAIAVMLSTMKSCKVNRTDIKWDRVMDHKCELNGNIRIVWARLYREVIRRIIRISNGTASDDDCSLMNLIESLDIQMVVYVPEEIKYPRSKKIETRPYKVDPFTRIIHGTNRMLRYVKIEDIDIRNTSIVDVLSLEPATVATEFKRVTLKHMCATISGVIYSNSMMSYERWVLAMIQATPIAELLYDATCGEHVRLRTHYRYEDFLVDVALSTNVTKWIVSALYTMMLTEIHGANVDFSKAMLTAEPGSSLDEKQRDAWGRCVELMTTSKSIPEALGRFQCWIPLYNSKNEWVGDVNFGSSEFRTMATYPLGYVR